MGGRRYEIVTGSPWVIPGEIPNINVCGDFQIELWLDLLATTEA